MNKIIVVYDLCGDDKNYDGLIRRLKTFPKCIKINKSSWLINTTYNCEKVRDELKTYIDGNDSLFVAALTGEAAWYNVESSNDNVIAAL